MIYQVIRELSSEFNVVRVCHTMSVSRSAYYAWLQGEREECVGQPPRVRDLTLRTDLSAHLLWGLKEQP